MENTIEYKGYNIRIEQDEDPQSPRDWDNLGTLVCFHNRYDLGDKTDLRTEDFNSWGEVAAHLKQEENAVLIFPVYLYDHSGLRIKIGDFYNVGLPQGHAQYDSGQVGFIYVSRETLLKEYGGSRVTKGKIAKASKVLESEIHVYDQYLAGDTWGYIISNDEDDHIDSCWGYFGYKDCLEQAKESVECAIKQAAWKVEHEISIPIPFVELEFQIAQ